MRPRRHAVGNYVGAITASGQTSTNYTITYVAGNLTVTPAPLTITANNVTRIYGAAGPALGVSYSGFVNGETSSVLGGTLSVVDADAAPTTGVGSYAGVITASGQTSTNYTITYVAGNLTVTPAALTITANNVTRVYGAADPALGVSYSGFVNGETSSVLGGTLSVVDADAAPTTGVGSYAGVITASGHTSTNYTITYVAGNLTVTPAALTITANDVTRVYGAADPALGVSYSGFVNGETSSVLGGTLSVVDADAAPTTGVGSYAGVITASGQTSTNYTITYVAGNLTVTPAALTITANNVTRVYGAADPTLGVSYSGFVNGETSSVLGGTLSVVDADAAPTTGVGSYAGVITASGQTSTNYTITYVAGNLTVTPAALTITANGVTRVYGAADPALGVSYSGFVNGETSSVLGGTLSVVDADAATTTGVGSYAGVITASGQTSTNYTITYVAGNLTVTPARADDHGQQRDAGLRSCRPGAGRELLGLREWRDVERAGRNVVGCRRGCGPDDRSGQLRWCDHGLRSDVDELHDHVRRRQSDGHAGGADDHGQQCDTGLRSCRSCAGSELLGVREWRDVQRAGRYVVGRRLGRGDDDRRGQLRWCDHGVGSYFDELHDHVCCRQSDGHAGRADDHGQQRDAGLRSCRSRAGSELLGVREWRDVERAGRNVVGCRRGRGPDDRSGQLRWCDHGVGSYFDELHDHVCCRQSDGHAGAR